MATEAPVNGVSTTLASSITSTATTCSLTSATGFTNAQYHCLITDGTNYEIVTATGLSGTTLTITRASESWHGSATAYGFSSGATISVVSTVGSANGLIRAALPSTFPSSLVSTVTFTRATGFPQYGGVNGSWQTQAITTANVGDVVLVALLNGGNSTPAATTYSTLWYQEPSAITDTNSRITWDTAPIVRYIGITDTSITSIWKGVVTSTGTTTVTANAPAAPQFSRITVDEWTPSSGTVYDVAVGTNLRPCINTKDTSNLAATTAYTFASLTAPPTGGLYWGFHFMSTAGSAGSTSGFTYTVTTGSNILVVNGSLTPGTTYAPTGTLTSGYYGGPAIILTAQ